MEWLGDAVVGDRTKGLEPEPVPVNASERFLSPVARLIVWSMEGDDDRQGPNSSAAGRFLRAHRSPVDQSLSHDARYARSTRAFRQIWDVGQLNVFRFRA